ncbi:MAG: hypothetical protein HND50_11940 [Calditrichaeota bacterium]|nr:hypothetical protein [Calditrichota bacterium]
MSRIYKTYEHNPPHLFIPEAKYFVTASTYKHFPYLKDDAVKHKMLEILQKGCTKYNWQIDDWVILDDHYHFMLSASPNQTITIADVIKNLHKFTAMFIRKYKPELTKENKIFHNYWDTCITYERSYYTRLNYIYLNPVKHGYANDPQEYQFGSFHFRYKYGDKEINKILSDFPSDKLDLENMK